MRKLFGVWPLRQACDSAHHLLALALIHDRGPHLDAVQLANFAFRILRNRFLRFNSNHPDGLIDGKAPGPTSQLSDAPQAHLQHSWSAGPTLYLDGVVRWHSYDLTQCLLKRFLSSLTSRPRAGRCMPWVCKPWGPAENRDQDPKAPPTQHMENEYKLRGNFNR